MMYLKKAATIAMVAGGIVAATAGAASATSDSGAHAQGQAAHSPGVASGNLIQVPVSVPINACGNTVNVVGLLNPTFGNTCINK